jgi:hypothetical protein
MNFGDVYNLDKAADGYVRLADDNLFHIGTLRTRQYKTEFGSNRERLPLPDAILQDSFYARGFGVGVRHRGAAVVTQVTTNASYTPPTIKT